MMEPNPKFESEPDKAPSSPADESTDKERVGVLRERLRFVMALVDASKTAMDRIIEENAALKKRLDQADSQIDNQIRLYNQSQDTVRSLKSENTSLNERMLAANANRDSFRQRFETACRDVADVRTELEQARRRKQEMVFEHMQAMTEVNHKIFTARLLAFISGGLFLVTALWAVFK